MDGWMDEWMGEQNERNSEIADSTDIFCLSCLSPLQAKDSNNTMEIKRTLLEKNFKRQLKEIKLIFSKEDTALFLSNENYEPSLTFTYYNYTFFYVSNIFHC